MKKMFVYKSEIFDCDIFVCVGVKVEDVKKWADKRGTKEFKIMVREDGLKKFDKTVKNNTGFLYNVFDKEGTAFYILWLKTYKNDWKSFEVLLHEIVHFKQFQWQNKNINDGIEFEAYFIESTFRSLRQRLFKELKL